MAWTFKIIKWSEVAQLCPTLCNPMDWNPPGSSIHGIFQARILEWVAISFSRGSPRPRDWTWVSHIVSRHLIIWATREAQGGGDGANSTRWRQPAVLGFGGAGRHACPNAPEEKHQTRSSGERFLWSCKRTPTEHLLTRTHRAGAWGRKDSKNSRNVAASDNKLSCLTLFLRVRTLGEA